MNRPVELSADELMLLLQGLEALRFMTSEVLAHDGPNSTDELKAEATEHLAFLEATTVKLEAVLEQLDPSDMPAGVVQTVEPIGLLGLATFAPSAIAGGAPVPITNDALRRAAAAGVDVERAIADDFGQALAAKVAGEFDRQLEEPMSSACKRERWCVRQVGHPGDCAAIMLADGSVAP